MSKIDSKALVLALLNGLDEANLLDDIKAKILDRDEFDDDDIYAMACDVFLKTSEEYFAMAFQIFGVMFSTGLSAHLRGDQPVSA